jgi:hypothetical protein
MSALYEWGRRENPPYLAWEIVKSWIEELDVSPWQAPSTPFPELSDPPIYECRTAVIADTDGVDVFYRRQFDGEFIDLIWVGRTEVS